MLKSISSSPTVAPKHTRRAKLAGPERKYTRAELLAAATFLREVAVWQLKQKQNVNSSAEETPEPD